MRLFIWQTLTSQGLGTPWYGPYWSCYPYCPLDTKACLIGTTGLVQTSRGFWKFTRGQPSSVTTSETRGRGKFRFGHFEASNPDETQGRGLLGRRGGGGTQESSGWVGGNITDIQHASAPGKDPGLQIPGAFLFTRKQTDFRALRERNQIGFLYLSRPAGKASRRELVTCPKIPHSKLKPSLFLMIWHNLRERLLIWLKVILKSDLRWIHK